MFTIPRLHKVCIVIWLDKKTIGGCQEGKIRHIRAVIRQWYSAGAVFLVTPE